MYDKTHNGNNICLHRKQWKVENEQNIFNKKWKFTHNSLDPTNKKHISVTHFYCLFVFYAVVLEQYPWRWPRKPQYVEVK